MIKLTFALLPVCLLACTHARADFIVTMGPTTPTVNGADFAELDHVDSSSEKTWTDTANHGVAFNTGGESGGYTLYGLSLQVNGTSNADPDPADKVWDLRVIDLTLGAIQTSTVSRETGHTSSGNWVAGDWFTWTFDAPVQLDPGTSYGVDIQMTSGGAYQPGIPYFRRNNSNTDGDTNTFRYNRVDGDPTIINTTTQDFVYHIDLAPTSVIPEPSTAALLSLAGLGLLRRLRRRH